MKEKQTESEADTGPDPPVRARIAPGDSGQAGRLGLGLPVTRARRTRIMIGTRIGVEPADSDLTAPSRIGPGRAGRLTA
jgi:hypothetical protein